MLRLVLLLLAFGALALFVFQNVSPALPLVVLGVPTIALPVGLWVLGAIAAGAFTSILIAGLTRLAAPRPIRSTSRRSATTPSTSGGRNPASPSGSAWKAPAWAADWSGAEGKAATSAARNTQAKRGAVDDWEQSAQRDDWDNWAAASPPPATSPPPRKTSPFTAPAFAEDNPFQLSDEEPIYQEIPYDEPAYQEREVWDDWEEDAPRSARHEEPPPPPQRDFVEIRRNPQTQNRSGTIYSYTYRKEDEEPTEEEPPPPKSDRVVDADFRVITPPYRPDASPTASPDDEELEEWDDWEYEQEKPADEPDEPYQNPPLNLGNDPRRDR